MQKRKLGKSGIEISAVGLGCWAIGGVTWRDGNPCGWSGADDRESVMGIQKAMDMGINFLDTADVYGCGHSEKLIAEAISGKRDQLIIATKFGFPIDPETRITSGERCDPDYIRAACEASLVRLKTDYIDLYQFHLGGSDEGEAVMVVLEDLVKEGKIRYYGWSTDDPGRARVFANGKHCIAIQQHLNVFSGNAETLQVCEDTNLTSINRGPLAMGLLTGKFNSETTFPHDDVRHGWDFSKGGLYDQLNGLKVVREILTGKGRTLAQGAICWLWARSPVTVPIPGFKTVLQVEDNAGALAFEPLSTKDMAEIEGILQNGLHH